MCRRCTVGGLLVALAGCGRTGPLLGTGSAVYVSPLGSDANPGTPTEPLLTVTGGIASGAAEVFVAEGTYIEAPAITRTVELRGGFAPDWSDEDPTAHPVFLVVGTAGIAVVGDLHVRFEGLILLGADAAAFRS